MRVRTTLPLLAVVVVSFALVACGISTSDKPKPIDRENLPAELAETDSDPLDSLPPNPDAIRAVPIWFLAADDSEIRLTSVTRRVPLPADAGLRLETLLSQGPTPEENQEGISTAIPADAKLTRPPEQVGVVLSVNLSTSVYELRGESAREAFAQLVYTATEIPGVDAVQFLLDGDPVAVPDGEGESDLAPRRREDYANLRPTT